MGSLTRLRTIDIELCAAETMRVIGMAEKYVARNKLQKGVDLVRL